jgi:hypothetical protein
MISTTPPSWLDRHETRILLVLTVLGVVLRLLWVHSNTVSLVALGEAVNVSRAFAETGTIADPFRSGQGATAHVMPLPMIVAGLVYRALGFDTPAANSVLTIWSMLQVFASFWFLYKAFGEAGAPLVARLAGFALLCLAPVNLPFETVYFRTWDGGLAVALSSLLLWLLLRADRAASVSLKHVAGLGLLAGLVMFISPPAGVAAYLCGALLLYRKVAPRRWPAAIAIVALAGVAVMTPWAVRNYQVFGRFIPLRDNFGLEFAQANYDGAVTRPDSLAEFSARHYAIHPYDSGPGYQRMLAAGGEPAYADALKVQTQAWVDVHPGDFAVLTGRHLGSMLFPPRWYFSRVSRSTLPRLASHWLVSALGLLGIALAAARLRARYYYLIIGTLVPLLPYALVQPTLRYRYLIFALLVYFACDAVARLVNARRGHPAGDRIAA